MTHQIIAEEYRGGKLENLHQGLVCAVNAQQDVIYEKGDIYEQVFYRSAMKPISAAKVRRMKFLMIMEK
ncbi:asparaginase [Virgibacillus siamensis]|uniref:asparaginase n=1 Tax=Virgibacillus siamensis TaxID=480071 RepID=UPI0009844CD4|nr:asparaginase [Virgibacillus siamensis]